MAEELQDNDAAPNEDAMDTEVDIEAKIQNAMLSRVSHFKEQADSLTFEGVRRLLEKDLCLETYALDVHKRYIKQCLVKCLEGVEEDNASKDSEETGGKSVSREEAAKSLEGRQSKKGVKEPCLEDEEKMEDSPVMGLLTGQKTTNVKPEGIKDEDDKDIPSESIIKKAIRKRTSYLKANSEKVTMAGVRRLLENDLKLTKYALDCCKKIISQQVEEILNSCEAAEQVPNEKKSSQLKTPKKVSKESSHSTEGSSSEEENDEVKPRKKNATKGRIPNSNETKKRKRSAKETVSAKKQSKNVQPTSENDSDEEGGENVSEDGRSESSSEKPVKTLQKEVSTAVYGKRVEHLKSVIKSCGMSVPPAIYKKVKQAPESKRESQLIKELEGILSREGLSANPTEKEIKDVRKKKERAKELEGIDLSNIVSSSRRRSTASYAAPPPPPPKPKIPVETDGDVDDTDEEEDDEEDDEEEDDHDEEDNGGDDESQGEEFNEDDNEDSD